ncbi:peptidyl-alpha-hydroxyglycine alpha-amidating lyase 2 [Nasonia vitripennis]|uniref:peptidylamidoglycolate lyase n=1 Tax=Nasonia vitripennis TaxID=7425 RepID=A0A7M7IW73_NASVI|nr:peptidyl-alpha-hydroxyglycine alpha-amidating lyase 2 [Nasonia vitripennis]
MPELLVALLAVLGSARAAAVYGEEYDAASGNFGLENELAYERRENEAIARLYENVLDILQCRLPHEKGVDPRASQEAFLAKQPVQDENWKSPQGLGQVSGVSVDPQGRPVVFHRGDHIWEYDSFDAYYQYTKALDGPIGVNTVLTLNPESGEVEDEWGSDAFYLPHGVHVDPAGNFWLTDVALHQVFKFPRRERGEVNQQPEPSLVLGERFVPGDDSGHFCQPTAVAVMNSGEIVVADGYCNDRILIFNPQGNVIGQLPPYGNEDFLRLRVPHSLTILKRGDVCVADREHQRIVCFNLTASLEQQQQQQQAADGEKEPQQMLSWPPLVIHRPGVCRIFGVTSHDDMLYAINGPTTPNNPVMGFTLNPDRGSVISTWGPTYDSFSNPHEIAACPNGTALYVSEIGPNVVWKFRLLTNWKM